MGGNDVESRYNIWQRSLSSWSPAHVDIQHKQREKLHSERKDLSFLGYDELANTYRPIEKSQILVSTDVFLNECEANVFITSDKYK